MSGSSGWRRLTLDARTFRRLLEKWSVRTGVRRLRCASVHECTLRPSAPTLHEPSREVAAESDGCQGGDTDEGAAVSEPRARSRKDRANEDEDGETSPGHLGRRLSQAQRQGKCAAPAFLKTPELPSERSARDSLHDAPR